MGQDGNGCGANPGQVCFLGIQVAWWLPCSSVENFIDYAARAVRSPDGVEPH